MTKIIIDTDIGDDIDDAFAIALACQDKNCELVAVTTVYENVERRAEQAKQLLEVSENQAPVYSGEGMPYCGNIVPFANETGDLISNIPCQYDESMAGKVYGKNAPEKIVELAHKYAGELVVVPIGAMTNIARAIQLDPSIVNMVKIVSMGGWFTNFQPEWNILCDPEAADIVYSSGVPVYAVGLDVTLQCGIEKELLDEFRASKFTPLAYVIKWMDRWFDYFHFEKSVMHDPLALCCALYEDVCTFEKVFVKVVTEGEKRGAVEVNKEQKQGFTPIYTASTVNKDKFYSFVRENLLK